MKTFRHLKILLLASLFISMAGCTIVRYVDNDDNGGGGNGGTLDPQVIDVLVLVDLDRGSSNLMSGYASYLALVDIALAEQNIIVRRTAVAPMYRQQSGRPLLLFGEDDPNAPFRSLQEALAFYTTDAGLAHLDGRVDAPGENLAVLGMNMDRESIFNPHSTPTETIPYFHEAQDGFVVFHLTGRARQCSHSDPDCALDEMTPAQFFTATDDDTGQATWLSLPGPSGVSPSKIMHVSIATAEGIDYATFSNRCLSEPHFPANHLDLLEPSEHNVYFGPFVNGLKSNGGHGINVDLCVAFSSRSPQSAANTAGQISGMMRR